MPAPALLAKVPALLSAADIPETDVWILQAAGAYAALATLQAKEHACMDQLRKGGVIR